MTGKHKQTTDLSPLQDTSLQVIQVPDGVADLSVLSGLPLIQVALSDTSSATDLTPLAGLPLQLVYFNPARVRKGVDALRGMKTLKGICGTEQSLFWKKYDSGGFPPEGRPD